MPATIALMKDYFEGADRQRALSFWSIGSWDGSGYVHLLVARLQHLWMEMDFRLLYRLCHPCDAFNRNLHLKVNKETESAFKFDYLVLFFLSSQWLL